MWSIPYSKRTMTRHSAETTGTSRSSHTGDVLHNVVVMMLRGYSEAMRLLPGDQSGFQPDHSTTGMMVVMRGQQDVGRKARMSLLFFFVDPQKEHNIVGRTLLWLTLTITGVPLQVAAVIRQSRDEMRACV